MSQSKLFWIFGNVSYHLCLSHVKALVKKWRRRLVEMPSLHAMVTWKNFSFVDWFYSKNKIVEGTKTNWSFLLEYVVMMLNYLIWFPISYFDSSMFSIFHDITLSLLNWRLYLILNYQIDTRNKFLFFILSRNLLIWWWYKVFGTHLWNLEFMYQNHPPNWCV